MNVHEYQAKEIFARYGVPAGEGKVARSADEAVEVAKSLGGERWVVKAQVHAGGRGKAGGVKLCDSVDDVRQAASDLIGGELKTQQTGDTGLPIHAVYVEKPADIESELYLSVLVDRATRRVTFIASPEGGVDIEEVADKTPERITQVAIHPAAGFQAYQAREIGFFLGLDKKQVGEFVKVMKGLYEMFVECDASLVEINPLVTTKQGGLIALDGKLNFDDNALFRHKEFADMRDMTQENEREAKAAEHDLNYIQLDGNIGCMVNGAGLAMGTMDLVKLHGGEPANFLDVGGGATTERVTEAFKLITAGEGVKAILVNIFGGIVRCDLIAEGIITAAKDVGIEVPVVVRLEGTNAEAGRKLLDESDFDLIAAQDLTDAAKKVVAEARG
ncbi:ADP-forming succinate--CoA ligase subunit beta [Salinisphaera orenii]|uniref:Succinate--CoA ligase [ADP-forming] subunit beta n=1 Tax=Salinisphaera orenii YIM 95161 TaxID=1051139 RepID=A0A423QAX8_9GAMM|nr:ADP-forming succinate--CoA ligase subunit beta [Salinisphaera halophila]ROO37639.1 malate--CoA ligase subunit beta [Salinisphaera halophila YIM 95161]